MGKAKPREVIVEDVPRKRRRHRPRGPQPIVLDDRLANAVLRGAKTQHRYGSDRPCRHRIDDVVPVLRKGADEPVCHVRVLARYRQAPGDVTDAEARAEGYEDAARFREARSFRASQVWALDFEVVEADRFMAAQDGQYHPRQYTASAPTAIDDAPCPPESYVEDLVRHNERRHAAARKADREGLALHQRVADLEACANAGDRQAQRHLFVITQRVEAAERRQARAVA